jgi:hypothetical protein
LKEEFISKGYSFDCMVLKEVAMWCQNEEKAQLNELEKCKGMRTIFEIDLFRKICNKLSSTDARMMKERERNRREQIGVDFLRTSLFYLTLEDERITKEIEKIEKLQGIKNRI